jgi:pimeloyl-ACP methyl ester carboxylesterase
MDFSSMLDNPLFLQVAFHPRRDEAGSSALANAHDGLIPIPSPIGGGTQQQPPASVSLGYRFHVAESPTAATPVFIFFHGNAEIASDYDAGASRFLRMGGSLIVVDFRGYGWSTGTPLLSKLTSDAEAVLDALPAILSRHGCGGCPLILFGRSIGSTCAVHLAAHRPDSFRGVIIESGITVITELPMVKQLGGMIPGGEGLVAMIPDVFQHCAKLSRTRLPLLVLHGEDDEIAPVSQGQDMHDASGADLKTIKRFPHAGHNDLLQHHGRAYFQQVELFVNQVLGIEDEELKAAIIDEEKAAKKVEERTPTARSAKASRKGAKALREGDPAAALTYFTKALRLCPVEDNDGEEQGRLCDARAHCYFLLGRHGECVDDCDSVLALRPGDMNALQRRLQASVQLGRRAQTEADAEQILQHILQGMQSKSTTTTAPPPPPSADRDAATGLLLAAMLFCNTTSTKLKGKTK